MRDGHICLLLALAFAGPHPLGAQTTGLSAGYLVLTLTDADAQRVRSDVVRPLVEKAAARRK